MIMLEPSEGGGEWGVKYSEVGRNSVCPPPSCATVDYTRDSIIKSLIKLGVNHLALSD